MIKLKPGPRHDLAISGEVQRFVKEVGADLELRRVFFHPFRDVLSRIGDEEERSRLENLVVITKFMAHSTQIVDFVNVAREKQRGRHSPAHKFLLDYQVIGNTMNEKISKKVMDSIIKLGRETHTFKKCFISLCPRACYSKFSMKPSKHCEICHKKTIIFPFYRVEGNILNAWKENVMFEAWVYSLLRRNQIPCRPLMTIFRDKIDAGEVDLISRGKFIVEIKTGGNAVTAARSLLGKNTLLGGKHELVLVYLERVRDKIKKMLERIDIVVLDNAISDENFDERLLGHFKTS